MFLWKRVSFLTRTALLRHVLDIADTESPSFVASDRAERSFFSVVCGPLPRAVISRTDVFLCREQ